MYYGNLYCVLDHLKDAESLLCMILSRYYWVSKSWAALGVVSHSVDLPNRSKWVCRPNIAVKKM